VLHPMRCDLKRSEKTSKCQFFDLKPNHLLA
jgi:hypothetical protein